MKGAEHAKGDREEMKMKGGDSGRRLEKSQAKPSQDSPI